MKVASTFDLKWNDQNLFTLWLETLPIRLSIDLTRSLWKESKGKKTALWTKKGGFKFY